MSVIKAEGITKTYTETAVPVHALNGIDLEVQEGEFTAIVGPSGCGKTTLLNILGGLDNPTTGTVEVNKTSVTELYDAIEKTRLKTFKLWQKVLLIITGTYLIYLLISIPKIIKGVKADNKLINFRLNNIGFVFQAYNLIPVLTNKENVEFIMLLQKASKQERDDRADDLLKQMGISDKSVQRPFELSGGQQQRVAVARALASKPKFILADEPTANLDSVSTANLLDMMAKMNAEQNATFVFSTHDQRVIDKAKRIVTLEDGKIVSDETRS